MSCCSGRIEGSHYVISCIENLVNCFRPLLMVSALVYHADLKLNFSIATCNLSRKILSIIVHNHPLSNIQIKVVIVCSSDSINGSSDPSKGSYDLSNGVTASSSESGLSGFLKGTVVYSFESKVSETITIRFPFRMMQCILCV